MAGHGGCGLDVLAAWTGGWKYSGFSPLRRCESKRTSSCYRLDKPERELKGFAKTPELAPGETCTVKVFVSKDSLASFDEKAGDWVVESGKYVFVAARDAADNSLKTTVRL